MAILVLMKILCISLPITVKEGTITIAKEKHSIGSTTRPSRAQTFVTRIAMEMHNSFEKQGSVHRAAI
jgi:hypothetical protein